MFVKEPVLLSITPHGVGVLLDTGQAHILHVLGIFMEMHTPIQAVFHGSIQLTRMFAVVVPRGRYVFTAQAGTVVMVGTGVRETANILTFMTHLMVLLEPTLPLVIQEPYQWLERQLEDSMVPFLGLVVVD
jgi:hypothetical protein